MQIITSLPRYSDGEINRALIKEIRTGFQFERANEEHRERRARLEARQIAHQRNTPFGRPVATIPARDYFRLIHKYGTEEVHSREFLTDFQKRFKELSPNAI